MTTPSEVELTAADNAAVQDKPGTPNTPLPNNANEDAASDSGASDTAAHSPRAAPIQGEEGGESAAPPGEGAEVASNGADPATEADVSAPHEAETGTQEEGEPADDASPEEAPADDASAPPPEPAAPPKPRIPEEPPLTPEEEALLAAYPIEDTLMPDGSVVHAADLSVPLPYLLHEDGSRALLPGVESIFVTSSTFELIHVRNFGTAPSTTGGNMPSVATGGGGGGGGHSGAGEEEEDTLSPPPPVWSPLALVPKETLLHDMQFRGAISDFHPIKQAILDSPLETLLLYANEEDWFKDGNNVMVACSVQAAQVWESIAEKRAIRDKVLELREKAKRIAKRLPKSKRIRPVRPWPSRGSEAEISLLQNRDTRPKIHVHAERPRSLFRRDVRFADREAHDLWNSSHMECRPYKDPNFDVRRVELDAAVQAVSEMIPRAVQATPGPSLPAAEQTSARTLPPTTCDALLTSPELAAFLRRIIPRCERALQQNEILLLDHDDIDALVDEEVASGAKNDATITEQQSFTDLVYSKNKRVSAVQWVPGRRGCVAVACTQPLSFDARVEHAGRPTTAALLFWNATDPIHPEMVLTAPFEILAFRFHPQNADIVVGACMNGQVVLWDVRQEAGRPVTTVTEGGARGVAIARHVALSDVEVSHSKACMDLSWLPGLEVLRDGSVLHHGSVVSTSSSSSSSSFCGFFASVGADGALLFWDGRYESLHKSKRRDAAEAWVPLLRVPLPADAGGPLTAMRLNFNTLDLPMGGMFIAGGNEGDLVFGDVHVNRRAGGGATIEYVQHVTGLHAATIVTLARCPLAPHMILSVGDWSFYILREGTRQPVFSSPMAPTVYTAGAWSPTRPGVLFLTRVDGVLEVWDLLERSHEPAVLTSVSSVALRSMAFPSFEGSGGGGGASGLAASSASHFLAVGDDGGVLHVLELPRTLRRPTGNERKMMESFWARELARTVAAVTRGEQRSERVAADEAASAAAADGGGGGGGGGGAGLAPAPSTLQRTATIASGRSNANATPPALTTSASRMSRPSKGLTTQLSGVPSRMSRSLSLGPGVDDLSSKSEQEYVKLEAQYLLELGLFKDDGSTL